MPRKVRSEFKKCGRCKERKTRDQFYKDASQWDGFGHLCKICKGKQVSEKRPQRVAKKKEDFIKRVGPLTCSMCNRVFDKLGHDGITFHHKDPSNELFCVGRYLNGARNLDKITEECQKCIKICWPCHLMLEGIFLHKHFDAQKITTNILKMLDKKEGAI